MTVLETTDGPENGAKEPIKFPGSKEERREQRMRRRLERKSGDASEGRAIPLVDPDEVAKKTAEQPDGKQKERRVPMKRHLQVSWTLLSFMLMVALPGALTGFYYMVLASPQYVVETQFSVRGSSQSSMSSFGLSGIFGTSVQNNDSYVVSSYIDSVQLIRDVKDQLGIDLRQYYSKNDVDFYYRIKPDMPLEKFTDYWRNMIAISFNSTTGNTTLYVYAFSADDSKAIADAVLKVSETLVNNLSESSRQQMTLMASKQVDRAEDRLRKVQEQTRTLRSEIKSVDLGTLTQQQQQLTQQLQNQLQQLKTRQATLLQSVSSESPTARSLQKQIKAAAASLAEQQKKLDGGKSDTVGDTTNVGAALNKFEELTVEQGFATQAYTSALAAFETALAEAQKQERYFATFIAPTRPEIALYPLRMLDSFIAFLVFLAVWMISQFLFRSFRDHAI